MYTSNNLLKDQYVPHMLYNTLYSTYSMIIRSETKKPLCGLFQISLCNPIASLPTLCNCSL